MRKVLIIIIAFTAFLSCKNKTGDKEFEVSGTLQNVPGKTVYLLEHSMFRRSRSVADSAVVAADGKYRLKTKAGEATAYSLYISGSNNDFAVVINDAGRITVDAVFNKENNQYADSYEVKGSKASSSAKDFLTGLAKKMQDVYQFDKMADSLQQSGAADSLLSGNLQQRRELTITLKNFVVSSVNQSENPALTFYELGNYQGMAGVFGLEPISNEEVDSIVNNTVKRFPDHEGWAAFKGQLDVEKIRQQQQADKSWVGKQAPEIAMPDPNGNVVKLSSYRGKYVLVDFWASWCKPCRDENPTVVAAYNKYKKKNFDILGVSLDNPGGKDKWLAAIKKDNLAWTQVSELKGWETSAVVVYGFGQEGIPYNILVDPQGKIIAERLRGPALEAKLAEALQ